ncbi:MAG: DUF5050 domain-containing protein [Spirochaetales bacterium]|nr:DUF5050 domain-containing protein [Spirochaetales bacterium]
MKRKTSIALLTLIVASCLLSCTLPGNTQPPVSLRIFWARSNGAGSFDIRRADLADPANTAITIVSGLTYRPEELTVDSTGNKLYWTDYDNYNKILCSNLDGTGVQTVVSVAGNPVYDCAVDSERGHLYWNEGKMIRRGNLDGSGAQDVYENLGTYVLYLSLDSQSGRIYFHPGTTIMRVNTDGTGPLMVCTASIQRGMDIDAFNKIIFWVQDLSRQGFEQADLDGENKTLIDIGENPNKGFTVDPNGFIYYGVFGDPADSISRCTFAGTGITPVITEEDGYDIHSIAIEFE